MRVERVAQHVAQIVDEVGRAQDVIVDIAVVGLELRGHDGERSPLHDVEDLAQG